MCSDGCERVNDCVCVYSYTHERAQAEAGPPLQHCCDSRDAGESYVKGGCVPGAAREPASPPVSLLVVFSPLSGWHLSWVGVLSPLDLAGRHWPWVWTETLRLGHLSNDLSNTGAHRHG